MRSVLQAPTCSCHQQSLPRLSGCSTSTFHAGSQLRQRTARPSSASRARHVANTAIKAGQAPPQVTPRTQDMAGDPFGLLLRQRIVFLGGEVNDFSADAVISQLLLLDSQAPNKDIKLFINSPGGSVTAGMGVYDAMMMCRCDVQTYCFGLAASMGAFLLGAGTKGKRYSMPNARIMIHQPLGGASGQTDFLASKSNTHVSRAQLQMLALFDSFIVVTPRYGLALLPVSDDGSKIATFSHFSAVDVEIQAREIIYHKTNLNNIMSGYTGQPFEKLEEDTDRDRYMSPIEAKDYGLIDHVIGGDDAGFKFTGNTRDFPKTKEEYVNWGDFDDDGSRTNRFKGIPIEPHTEPMKPDPR